MLSTPDWWPHNVESWLELKEFFALHQIYNKRHWLNLPQGQSNHNYKLELPDKNYFVQSVSSNNLELLPVPEKRVSQLTLAAIPELRAYLVDCYIDNSHIKISEWFDAVDGKAINFSDQGLQFQLASFLSKLHRVEIGVNSKIGEYRGSSGVETTDFSKGLQDTMITLPVLNIESHLKKYYDRAIEKMPDQQLEIDTLYGECRVLSRQYKSSCFCHNDLSLSNILNAKVGETLKIIDWEYACIGDPMFDLASFINNCFLSDQQTQVILKHYAKEMGTEIDTKHLNKMRQLSSKLSELWTLAG